eukprot:9396154-Pyramimonas_sp.AAC.1
MFGLIAAHIRFIQVQQFQGWMFVHFSEGGPAGPCALAPRTSIPPNLHRPMQQMLFGARPSDAALAFLWNQSKSTRTRPT